MAPSETQPKISFREAVLRNNLITPSKFDRIVSRLATDEESEIAAALVKAGVLTDYQSQQLLAGRSKLMLGPYLITDFIGQGGMGRVFKAVHDVMGRQCAVKVLPIEKSTREARHSFRQEIRTQAGLDSPYLVRAFDAGLDGRVPYLVTEYVPGRDLRRLIKDHGPLSMNEAAMVISQAALGLHYAHEIGIVHRDVKPGNILVTPDGHAKVSDIGLASWTMSLESDPRAGKIVGTADYLSPEQINDPRSVSSLSDIYSLGCTLYYTVTGKVPFPGGDTKSKCRRHCEQTAYHPRRFAPDLSEAFVDLIADMMEKDPQARIQSAAEVAERLEPWASAASDAIESSGDHSTWMPGPPPSDPSQLRNPSLLQPLLQTEIAPAARSLKIGKAEKAPPTAGEPRSVSPASVSPASVSPGSVSPGSGSLGSNSPASGNISSGELRPGESGQPSVSGLDLPGHWEPVPTARPSHTLAIAIALSIAVPISLLIGAILGFLVRGYY